MVFSAAWRPLDFPSCTFLRRYFIESINNITTRIQSTTICVILGRRSHPSVISLLPCLTRGWPRSKAYIKRSQRLYPAVTKYGLSISTSCFMPPHIRSNAFFKSWCCYGRKVQGDRGETRTKSKTRAKSCTAASANKSAQPSNILKTEILCVWVLSPNRVSEFSRKGKNQL